MPDPSVFCASFISALATPKPAPEPPLTTENLPLHKSPTAPVAAVALNLTPVIVTTLLALPPNDINGKVALGNTVKPLVTIRCVTFFVSVVCSAPSASTTGAFSKLAINVFPSNLEKLAQQ